ncbi:hypothetical protein BLA29_009895 [Euroglyphus maynei]|uniref:Uncharacterized protein n=1 Tax=Euroglyphus maynei TaxID=6958 RepID=A0A1Y3BTS3_EURMA|nr:hypothetical protein BLA29_009895 [Euroglyphus maynei]
MSCLRSKKRNAHNTLFSACEIFGNFFSKKTSKFFSKKHCHNRIFYPIQFRCGIRTRDPYSKDVKNQFTSGNLFQSTYFGKG